MVTSSKPLLPTYSDSESDSTGSRRGSMEKTPHAAAAFGGHGAFDESSTVLTVGNSRPKSALTRTKDRCRALGTGKKILVLAGVGWAACHLGHGAWHHLVGHRRPPHHPHDFSVPGTWDAILEHDHVSFYRVTKDLNHADTCTVQVSRDGVPGADLPGV